MPVGQIASLAAEKGFGFIKPEGSGDDVFFHNSVANCPIESLKIGQRVEYELDTAAEKVRAKSVTVSGGGGTGNDRHSSHTFTDKRCAHKSRVESAAKKTECGFVTKLLRRDCQGFISADAGGAELLFDQSDVSGDKRFQQMKVGDYVRFVRNPPTEPNPNHDPPTATAVQAIERVPQKQPKLELPNNPKARRKKPTWR